MDLFFTTVVRGGSLQQSGELVRMDWESKQVVKRTPLIPFDPDVSHDPNPRGNARGGRGLLLVDNQLVAATYHSLHIYDLDLNFQKKISHPLFVNLHELAYDQGLIFGTSTAIDAVVAVDHEGNLHGSWWPRESPYLQKYLSISSAEIDKNLDHRLGYLDGHHLKSRGHLHLNDVAVSQNQLYVLLNRYGIVYNMTKDNILIEDESIRGCHNLILQDGYILINDTKGRRLMIFSQYGTLVRSIDLLKFSEVAHIYHKHKNNWITTLLNQMRRGNLARPIFVRGLFSLAESRVLISFSPATIIEIDYERERLLDCHQYSDDVRVTPHGLLAIT